jgi:hypothetical protein
MEEVHLMTLLVSMVISILIYEAFFSTVLKQKVSGHFHRIYKDQQVLQVQVEAMAKMEVMQRRFQTLQHLQVPQDHKVKKV